MKKFDISSSLNLHFHSKEDINAFVRAGLEFNKKMGFDVANLDLEQPLFDADGWQPYIENAVKASAEIGLPIKTAHLPFVGGGVQKDTEFLEKFNQKICRGIDGAKLLGVEHAVLHPIVPTLPVSKFNKKEQRELVLANLAPVVEYANKVGLSVVIENMRVMPHFIVSHRYCQAPDDLCDIADTLGIGVCWDFGHANISGVKQSEALEYIGKRLKVIHINDNTAFDDDHLLPFMGSVDWKDAMKGLKLSGFDGPFNYEIATSKLPAAVREDTAKYILSSAKELISYMN